MRLFCLAVFCAALCLRVVAYATAEAVDPAYIGVWQFTGAAPAPWTAVSRKRGAAERAHFLGKVIVFKPKGIAGPTPFACKRPRYRLRDFTAAKLFDGAFDAMHSKDESVDPGILAAKLGYAGGTIRTLETGCAFDVHFVDASTAQVGLDGFVYTLKKQ